jgi:hypothetical protein
MTATRRGPLFVCFCLTGCAHAVRPLTPTVDELGCVVPPPAVFQKVGFSVEAAKATIGKVDVAGTKVALSPDVIPLVSQAALDEQASRYLDCRVRKGYPADEAQWYVQLDAFTKTRPTPDQLSAWQKEHPSPAELKRRQLEEQLRTAPDTRLSAPTSPDTRDAIGTSGASPSPTERIRTTVERFSVGLDKRTASLVILVENLTHEAVGLILENNDEIGVFAGPRVSLLDDRAVKWFAHDVTGLQVMPCCRRSLGEIRPEDYTVLGPAGRTRIAMTFSDDNNGMGTVRAYNAPGSAPPRQPTLFSFSADAVYRGASGPERFSIQLPSIRAPR